MGDELTGTLVIKVNFVCDEASEGYPWLPHDDGA
jgi:hypothetical protein